MNVIGAVTCFLTAGKIVSTTATKDSVMLAWPWWSIVSLILVVVVFCAVAWVISRRRKTRTPSLVESNGSPPRPPLADDNVQFTVYRPRAVLPDQWYTLLAFAHLSAKRREGPASDPDPVEEVKRQAKRVLGDLETRTYQAVTQDAPQPVPREETVTFVPDVPGVEFNPPLRTFRWTESVHREEFRLRARCDLVGKTARGRLSVFLGDILLADVLLAIRVDEQGETPGDDSPAETEHARRYRKIFASYSHKDLHVVEQIERLAQALGDEYLRDWKQLRTGEVWDERLLQMIKEADVFQLFWSRHAMESPYVHQEYEFALSLNRLNFVRPTYWEDPLPSDPARKLPPETLLRLHFQRIGPFLLPAMGFPPSPPATPPDGRANPDVGPVAVPGYEIQKYLGRGGMGSVLLAKDQNLGHLVIIKLDQLRDGDLAVLGPEVPLHHPGIVPILAVGDVGNYRYTVKPYLNGGTLAQRLQVGPLPERGAAELALSLAAAVHYAHNWGVYHLNLEPSKVLFDSAGCPAVIGFHQIRLQEGVIFGTPAYMAPELAAGETTRLGPASDVYGLGVILYECLTGRPPFKGATVIETLEQVQSRQPLSPRQLNPKVSRFLELICLKCLEKDPTRRYQSASAVADDLRRFLVDEPICASPPHYARRSLHLVTCLVFALLLFLAAILWLAFH
jgi:hypothetical protein